MEHYTLAQTPNSDYNILEQVFYSAYKPEITRLFIENNVSLTTPINEKGQLVIHALLNQTGEKTWGQFIITFV